MRRLSTILLSLLCMGLAHTARADAPSRIAPAVPNATGIVTLFSNNSHDTGNGITNWSPSSWGNIKTAEAAGRTVISAGNGSTSETGGSEGGIELFTADSDKSNQGLSVKGKRLYFCVWPTGDDTDFMVGLNTDRGNDGYSSDVEKSKSGISLTANTWNIIDVAVSDLSTIKYDKDMEHLWQVAFKNLDTDKTYYIDNVVFYDALKTPSDASSNVQSLYSDSYTAVTGLTVNGGNQSSTFHTALAHNGNNLLQYVGFSWMTFSFNAETNLSSAKTLHASIWTDKAFSADFAIAGDQDHKQYVALKANQWNEVWIPMSAYANAGQAISKAGLLGIGSGGVSANVFIDDVYFSTVGGPESYPTPTPQGAVLTVMTDWAPYADAVDVTNVSNARSDLINIDGHEVWHLTGSNGSEITTDNIGFSNSNLSKMTRVTFDVWPGENMEYLTIVMWAKMSDNNKKDIRYKQTVTPKQWNRISFYTSNVDETLTIANMTGFEGFRFYDKLYSTDSDKMFTSGREIYIANIYFDNPTPTLSRGLDVNLATTAMAVGDTRTATVDRAWDEWSWVADDETSALSYTYSIANQSPATAGQTVATVDTSSGVITAVNPGTFRLQVTATYSVNDSKYNGGAAYSNSYTWTSNDDISVYAIAPSPAQTVGIKDVYNIYSDFYGNNHAGTYSADCPYGVSFEDWSGCTLSSETYNANSSRHYKKLSNFKWAGIHIGNTTADQAIDVSAYDRLHVDVYSPEAYADGIIITPITYVQEDNSWVKKDYSLDTDASHKKALQAGWTSIDIDLTALAEVSGVTLNMAKLAQIAFKNGNGSNLIAIDNVYFWKSGKGTAIPASTDTDGQGLYWDSTNGAQDYIARVFEPSEATYQTATLAKCHDGDNSTYSEASLDNGTMWNDATYVFQLYDGVKVSDLELIWGQGFPKSYKIYGSAVFPLKNGAVDTDACTLLYETTSNSSAYSPYFDSRMNINGDGAEFHFIVLKMDERVNETFPYMLYEARVGIRTNDYTTPHHIGFVDQHMHTGYENMVNRLALSAMNSRNVPISGTLSNVSVTPSDEKVHITLNADNTINIWASDADDYTATIGGSINDSPVSNASNNIFVYKDWTTDKSPQKSVVQEDGVTATAGFAQGSYTVDKMIDGKEGEDITSRWASNGNDDEKSDHEWVLIDLQKTYALNAIEVVWENAYAADYSVYGFKDAPTMPARTAEAFTTWKGNNAGNLIYRQVETQGSITSFPWHDSHVAGESAGTPTAAPHVPMALNDDGDVGMTSTNANQARYIAILAEANGNPYGWYGYSIWEVYAYGDDVTAKNAVDKLEAPDMTIQKNTSRLTSVTAVSDENNPDTGEPYTIELYRPVTFTIKNQSGDVVANVATISDLNDGYYNVTGLETGVYTVTMTAKNGLDKDITGSFTLTVINNKAPMALTVGTTATRHVYDDGYYSEDVLRNNSSSKVTIIHMEDVDFSSDIEIEGTDTHIDCHNPTIPAPRTLKTATNVQMNPNAIYYVDEAPTYYTGGYGGDDSRYEGVHGENVAFLQKDGSGNYYWLIHDLRLFDFWPYELSDMYAGGVKMKRGRFYMNLPKDVWPLVVPPFPMQYHKNDNKGANDKGVEFYTPTFYNSSEGRVGLTKVSEETMQGDDFAGHVFLVTTSKAGLSSTTGSYALALQSLGYNANNSDVAADRTILNNLLELGIDNDLTATVVSNLTFMGSYNFVDGLAESITAAGNSPYRLLGVGDIQAFVPMPTTYQLTPFYGYVEMASTNQAKPMIMLGIGDDEATGLSGLSFEDATPVDVYTTSGIKLRSGVKRSEALKGLAKGIYVVGGEKVVK